METAGVRRREQIEKLLVGESLDTSRLAYDFDLQHVGLVAAGPGGEVVIRQLVADRPNLVVEAPGGLTWGWVGSRLGFDRDDLGWLGASNEFAGVRDLGTRMAVGEPAQGLAGWRLTHRQARAALPVAGGTGDAVVRYGDVALLASALRDELLATSLRRLYLEPLEGGRDGGETLRRTLRAYLASDRNATLAGESIGVTRQAVTRRLRAVEQRLGRPLAACAAELELALRLEALDAGPTLLSAR